jgi:hypothetical protein
MVLVEVIPSVIQHAALTTPGADTEVISASNTPHSPLHAGATPNV